MTTAWKLSFILSRGSGCDSRSGSPWCRTFDLLLPWMGGGYRIRLRHAKGGPVLVWQGNSDDNFHANLAILKANTGLPIQPAGR